MTRSVSVFSLNIEKSKHLHLFPSLIRGLQPDIVLLQEVMDADTDHIADTIGMKLLQFNPMNTDTPLLWGLAVYVQKEHARLYNCISHVYYREKVDGQPLYRVIQYVCNPYGLTLCHTHFVWSADGAANEAQRTAGERLRDTLSGYDMLVLLGDSNTPRGKNSVWDVIGSECVDCIPEDIDTTLDPKLHRVQGLIKHVVDMCFVRGTSVKADVRLYDGISDHLGVSAVIHY